MFVYLQTATRRTKLLLLTVLALVVGLPAFTVATAPAHADAAPIQVPGATPRCSGAGSLQPNGDSSKTTQCAYISKKTHAKVAYCETENTVKNQGANTLTASKCTFYDRKGHRSRYDRVVQRITSTASAITLYSYNKVIYYLGGGKKIHHEFVSEVTKTTPAAS